MEVFTDDFSIFGNSFKLSFQNLDRVLATCEVKNLVLNWEKYDFLVKKGIFLEKNKVSQQGLEVDLQRWKLQKSYHLMCRSRENAVS